MKRTVLQQRFRLVVRGVAAPAVIGTVVAFFGACGGGREVAELELPECDGYVATYRTCSARQGLPPALIESRAVSMREDLRAAAKDEASRVYVRERCATSQRQTEEACR